MAKKLKYQSEIQQTRTIQSWHVSQSVEALTGDSDYDITISGSLTVTGSVAIDGMIDANGTPSENVVWDPSSGNLYITSSQPSFEGVSGDGCAKYNMVLSTDPNATPTSGQAILISSSVYGDNDEYGAIRIHEEDFQGNNLNNFLGTTLESKQFNLHWSLASATTTETNSSGQRFNQSVTIVTDISCSTLPAPNDPADSGSVSPPPYVSPSSSGVGPISMVYAETLQGLKTGRTAVSLVDIYLDPLFVYADLADTGSSAVFETTVFRRDNLEFTTEFTSGSIMAYANTYLNSSQFSFDPSIYDGTQTPYLYRTASMSSEAPEGYYIFASEYTDTNLLKNAAKYEGSGVFDDKFPGWNYTPPAPTPPADPTTITKCTVTTQTLETVKSGDYWEIPWELDAYSGSYAPTSFSSSYICFDADGSYSSAGGGGGGAGGAGGAGSTETLTALGYNDDSKLLAYVDEELAINIRDLNSAGNLDFKANGGSTVKEAGILNLIEGTGINISLSETPSGTAAYTITSSVADTGSLLVTSSLEGNIMTFEKGDGSTYDIDLSDIGAITGSHTGSVLTNTITSINWTGSGVDATAVGDDLTIYIPGGDSIDTGSFYLSSSVNLNTITFTQGDGTTESVTIDTGSAITIDTGSFYLSSSISGNTITFTQGDGTTESVTVDTGSGATIDTGSFYLSSSISGNTITFNQGDGTTESVTITNSSVITGSYTGSTLTNTIASINWTGSGVNATAVGDDLTIYIPGGDSTDTGSLLTTASISDATFTFTKGDGSTFNIEVNNVSSSISSSYATSASYAPNIYNTDGTLTDARVVTSDGNSLTFDMTTANFVINSDPSQSVVINSLPTGDNPQVLGIDASGIIKAMNTSSLASGAINTGSFYLSSSVAGNVITFTQGDGTTESVTINTGSAVTIDTGSFMVTGSVNSNVLTFEKGDGSTFDLTVDTGSSGGGGATVPGGPLNSFQFNDAGAFSGSVMYYDEANERVGLGIDSPVRPFHISSSNAVPIRLESTTETSQDIQFFGNQASSAGLRIGSTGNNDYRIVQGTLSDINLYISSSGNTYLPNIVSSSQANIIGYNSTSGELTYFDTASLIPDTFYTEDGTITGNRTVEFTGGNLNFTASSGGNLDYFQVATNEVFFPNITLQGNNAASVCMIGLVDGVGNGRLFYTGSDVLINSLVSSSTSDTQVLFNDGGVFAGESTFTYDKTNNTLTVQSAGTGTDRTKPSIELRTSDGTLLANEVIGQIQGANNASGGATANPALVFAADATWAGGTNYSSKLEFRAVNGTSEFVHTTMKSNGRMGIGTTNPTNGFLEVNGNVSGTSIYASANIVAYSDARSKTNVTTIDSALDKVDAIRGVTYNKVEDPDGIRYMGVIAQELQEVLPEVVAEGEDGKLAVAYGNITGVLIEAIKELRAEIAELKANK